MNPIDPKNDNFYLSAKALIVNKEGKLLVLQRNPKKLNQIKEARWDIPGGRIGKNESLETALKREVYEETGLQNIVRSIPFTITLSSIRIPTQHGDAGLIFATYLCEIADESSICLSDEHIRFDWTSPKKTAELLAANNFPAELTEKIHMLQASFSQN